MRLCTLALALLATLASSSAVSAKERSEIVLGPIEAHLFYHQSARLSGDILNRAEPFTGWNTVIGEGSAEEPADDLLVLVPLETDGERLSDQPIDLWASGEKGKVVARRRFASVLTSGEGKATLALWLNDVGCAGDLVFHAQMGKQERTATLALHCGE